MSHVSSHHIGEVALTSAVVSAARPRIEIDPDALIDSLDDVIANLRETTARKLEPRSASISHQRERNKP